MADLMINVSARVVPPIVRTARPVAGKVQQEIKSAVHQELIKRLDLEKIASCMRTAARNSNSSP